jgi:proteasome assembly chaperone (PAC2) family protein
MAPLLDVDTWPNLRDPVMVISLAGWVDAGVAGAGSMAVLGEQLEAQRPFGTIDLADLMDLQQTRPIVQLADGVTRTIEWPSIDFVAGRAGRDVVLCRGPEPSLRWRAVLGAITDAATYLGVSKAFTLAGIPSMVSHRRPVPIMSTATSADLLDVAGAFRNDYAGPTGAQTALQVMLGDAGVPTVALWAQVPHYISSGASPPAIRALLAKLRELGGLELDLTTLDDQTDAYVRRVEDGIADRPDVAEAIAAIESSTPDPATLESELPSGDELASEIEKFLRDQS